MQKCGGYGAREVTPEAQTLLTHHLADVNSTLGKTFTSLTATSYQVQIVAGQNHSFEFEANDGTKGSAKIFQPLPHTGQPTSLSHAKLL